MYRMRCIAFAWALFVLLPATGTSQTRSVELAYSLESSTVSAREPIGLTLTIKNNSDQPIAVDLGLQGEQNFKLTAVGPDGSTKTIVPPLHEGLAPRGDFKVLPGKSLAKHIVLSDWFDFTAAGRYQIEVRLTSPITGLQGEVVAADPGTQLSLDVSPADDSQLQKTCAGLLAEISSSTSYERAESAGKKLAAITDPVAVPYLLQATSFWHLEPITIRALRKIGDTTAVDALIGLLNPRNSDAAALARSALMQLEDRIADPPLRDRVHRALEPKL